MAEQDFAQLRAEAERRQLDGSSSRASKVPDCRGSTKLEKLGFEAAIYSFPDACVLGEGFMGGEGGTLYRIGFAV